MQSRTFLYALLVLFSVTLMAGAAALVWFDYDTTLKKAENGAEAAARAYAAHAARNLDELRYGVAWLARNVDPEASDQGVSPATADEARTLARHLPGLSALLFIDADARVRFSTITDAALGLDVSERDYFKAARDLGVQEFIGPAVQAKGTGRMVYTLSRRLERDGRFAGLVIASSRAGRWDDIVAPVVPVVGTQLRLLRSDGSVVVAQRTREGDGGLETVIAGNESSAQNSAAFILARVPVADSALVAEVAVPRTAALAPWEARRSGIMLGAALGIVALAIFGVLGHRSFRREAAATRALQSRTEELHRALETEKLLMAELQHRVKNSLSLAAAMLSLERAQAQDGGVQSALDRAQARILAIAKVHDRLNDSSSPSAVSLDIYLSGLCSDLAAGSGFRHAISSDSIVIPSAQAVSLGLIVTELLLNAAKHAGTGPETRIEVNARATVDGLVLTVRDYGRGVPEGFNVRDGTGLGMRIVANLLAQLDGRIEVTDAGPGSRFVVHVPLQSPERTAVELPASDANAAAQHEAQRSAGLS